MTYVACVILALLIPPILFDLIFRPAIRRIGVRNVARRPGEAALVILGSMLATALIVASFVVGDSFGASLRVGAETTLGPVDLLIDSDDVDADLAALTASLSDGGESIESLLQLRRGEVNVSNSQGKIETGVSFWEVEPASARAFGNDLDGTGLANLPVQLESGQVAVNERLAADLNLATGETLNIVAGETIIELEIVAVLERRGLAGLAPVILPQGGISEMLPNADQVFRDSIAVSNLGGTYEGAELSEDSEDHIRSVLGEESAVGSPKASTLNRADRVAENITTQFSTVGGFSVAAGILLMVNLFVMLAAERKVELGTMRAIGVQKGHTRRAFSIEGLVYGVAAAALGLLVGIGVAALVMQFAGEAFGVDADFELRLGVEPSSLFSGFVIGLAISLITVLLTTVRVVQVNIVAALKDTALPRSKGDSRLGMVIGLVVTSLGVLAWMVASERQAVAFGAPILMLCGLIPLLTRVIGQKLAMVLCGGFGLFWASAVFGILSDTFADPAIELFLAQGIVLVGLSVSILAVFDRWLIASIRWATRGSISSRLGLSNPLARPVRSALLVSMYALVIFTVTFTAILNTVLEQQGPKDEALAGGSYDLYVLSSQLSPLSQDQLVARPDIEAAVTVDSGVMLVASHILDRDAADFQGESLQGLVSTDDEASPTRRFVTLVSRDFVKNGAPTLTHRLSEFESDQQAWRSVAEDPTTAIVPNYFGVEVGDSMQLVDGSGNRFETTVVGLSDWNWLVGLGMYVSDQRAGFLVGENRGNVRHHVVGADGFDTSELVERLESDFAANGADANSFAEGIESEASETQAFISILQGFLGLGLLIGIAGLSVVLIRGVRERRQQLGMLRAIGFSPTVLRRSFLIEATFIGSQGVLLGIGLGILSSWQVLTRSSAFAENLDFAVPLAALAGLAFLALGASLLAGLFPAMRAGRTAPAEALRLAG